MRIEQLADHKLTDQVRTAVARYRYKVFVDSLRWKLPCEQDWEQDEFDCDDATHLVAWNDDGEVAGYARLLPTTSRYLLSTHFPQMLKVPPKDRHIWELSRFAAGRSRAGASYPELDSATRIGKPLLAAAVRSAERHGVTELLCCTTVAIERLARRWGVDLMRAGIPARSPDGLVVAIVIRCNYQTRAALEPQFDEHVKAGILADRCSEGLHVPIPA